MRELIKTDFRRVLKDKLLIVMIILGVVFAVITPLLYVGLEALINWVTESETDAMYGFIVTAKEQFFLAFSVSSDFGLIAPILLAIVLCKDFFSGTVRNKIIAGKSRVKIFMSLFTVCTVVLVSTILLYAFLMLGISLIFFDYQEEAFTMADFWYLLESVLFEILILVFIAAFISWLCVAMKNVGLVIVMYAVFSFGAVMIGSILTIGVNAVSSSGAAKIWVDMLEIVNRLFFVNSSAYIGVGSEYELKDVLFLTIPPIVCTLGMIGLGLLKFRKKDLK